MKIALKRLALGIVSAGLLTVYGCGGGSTSTPAASPPAATTTDVPITVVDGPIQNATVCLDKNRNGGCDAGEPFAKTDATGKGTLKVDLADVGKHPVIAVIDTDAIDTDRPTTPITVPFTMSAPADTVGVVSPLTTLVQQTVATTGASTATAAASVQAAIGITVSPLQDFTTPAAKAAAAASTSPNPGDVARMIVVTTQQQSKALGSTVKGSTAVDGATITQADIDKAIQKKILELLPALVTAMSDSAVQTASTPAAKEAALLAAANTLVTSSGLTSASMPTVVAINTQTSSTTPVPSTPVAASFNLVNLNFTDVSNFFVRAFGASLLQNTPDSNHNVKYVEGRYRNVAGSLAKWGAGSDPWRQADLHWTGSAWANCALNLENTSGVRDAQGNSTYNYCDNYETGKTNRATFDIAGKTMAAVYAQVRTARYTNLTIADASLLGTATFPAGSSLLYQAGTSLTTAMAYYPGSSNLVTQYSAAVSAGGVASTQTAGVGCNSTEFKNTNGTNSSTLEGMIGAMTGTPCVFGQGSFKYPTSTSPAITSPDTVDEAWGNSTVGIGTLGTAPVGTGTAPGFYSGNTKLRVAFKGTGSNPVTYYACKERFNNGGTRNCTVIGTGSYTIASLGDARVLTFNNAPTQASPLTFTRVFVERGGLVYAGYQNKPVVSNSARLNATAATALLAQLGLTADDPSVPLALTAASYQGTWDVRAPGADGVTIFVNANGSVSCQNLTTLALFACSATITNPSTGAFTFSDNINNTASGNLIFLTGTGSGTYSDPTSTPTTGNFVAQRR